MRRRTRTMTVGLVTSLAFVLAACATDAGAGSSAGGGSPSSPADGEPRLVIAEGPITDEGISVEEALGHQATDDLVTVHGALFVDPDGTVRLCDAVAESFPPQCGGSRILVEGLDLAAVSGLQTEGEISWAEGVTLFGSVE